MNVRRSTASIAGGAILLFTLSAARSETEACSFLTTADASKALGVTSVPGKRMMPDSPTGCVWSNDPNASDSSRRLVLNTHNAISFNAAKHTVITTIKIEAISGLGDDAFYALYPKDPPFIWVLKGKTAISIRIIIGTSPSPFTVDQEKAKLAVLAKAALAKL